MLAENTKRLKPTSTTDNPVTIAVTMVKWVNCTPMASLAFPVEYQHGQLLTKSGNVRCGECGKVWNHTF